MKTSMVKREAHQLMICSDDGLLSVRFGCKEVCASELLGEVHSRKMTISRAEGV